MQHAVFFADIDDGHAIARDRESLNGDGDNRTGIERRTAVSRATPSAIGIDTVRKMTSSAVDLQRRLNVMAKSHLKLVAPATEKRTVAPPRATTERGTAHPGVPHRR